MRQSSPSRKRFFEYLEKQGKLPKHLENDNQGYALGGMIEDDGFELESGYEINSFDLSMPEEDIEHVDVIKNMGKGLRTPNPEFARALRRSF